MHHAVVDGVVPVVSQLALPLKAGGGGHAGSQEVGDNVARVHVDGDEGAEHHAHQLSQAAAHQLRQVVQRLSVNEIMKQFLRTL